MSDDLSYILARLDQIEASVRAIADEQQSAATEIAELHRLIVHRVTETR